MLNQIRKTRVKRLIHFENAIYRVLHERSNDTAPFAEHPKFEEETTFIEAVSMNGGK